MYVREALYIYIYTYIYIYIYVCTYVFVYIYTSDYVTMRGRVVLYKILVYFEAFMQESINRALLSPTCISRTIAMLPHVDHAIYYAPHDLPRVYAIHHTKLARTISCKSQGAGCCTRRLWLGGGGLTSGSYWRHTRVHALWCGASPCTVGSKYPRWAVRRGWSV